MKKTAKPSRPPRPPPRSADIARRGESSGPTDEVPDVPEAPDAQNPGGPQQPGPVGVAGSRQSDIERVDERKSGSIESIAHAPLEQGADAFVEPPGNEPEGSPMPPYQRDD